jgi:hypothetical protein
VGPCPQFTFIVKVLVRLCPFLLDGFLAIHHMCPPTGLLLLLPSLQRLNEVVSFVCADEARLWEHRSRRKRGREKGGVNA